jgi:glutamate synthase domain-containing protein 1
MALNDRLKLRSMVVAERDDMFYIASEECAIREIAPDATGVRAPLGGEAVIAELNEEGRKRCL